MASPLFSLRIGACQGAAATGGIGGGGEGETWPDGGRHRGQRRPECRAQGETTTDARNRARRRPAQPASAQETAQRELAARALGMFMPSGADEMIIDWPSERPPGGEAGRLGSGLFREWLRAWGRAHRSSSQRRARSTWGRLGRRR